MKQVSITCLVLAALALLHRGSAFAFVGGPSAAVGLRPSRVVSSSHRARETKMMAIGHGVALGAAALGAASVEWDQIRTFHMSPRKFLAQPGACIKEGALGLVKHSYGFAPVFVALLVLTGILNPVASALAGIGYSAGSVVFRACYGRLGVTERLPVCFVANVAVIAILGSLSMYNALHAMKLLTLTV